MNVTMRSALMFSLLALLSRCQLNALAQSPQSIRYTVTPIEDGEHLYTYPTALNNLGQVIGTGPFYRFFWQDGVASYFDSGISPYALNDLGFVTGADLNGTSLSAFVWQNGSYTLLPALAGFAYSDGRTINAQNNVAGDVFGDDGVTRAVLWRTGAISPLSLGVLPTYLSSYTTAMNNTDQVVGLCANNPSDTSHMQAFSWTSQLGMQGLGFLPGGSLSIAYGVNTGGQITGRADSNGHSFAFLWAEGHGMQSLGTVVGDTDSEAFGINDPGQIVGDSFGLHHDGPGSQYTYHAVLWTQAEGMLDLNNLIDPASGWILQYALGINNRGQIIARGYQPGGQSTGVLLTPVAQPLPASIIHLTDNSTESVQAVDGIVCDNLPNMPCTLKNKLTVQLDSTYATATNFSVTALNENHVATDTAKHPNAGNVIFNNGVLTYYPPDEFNYEQQPQIVEPNQITKASTRTIYLKITFDCGGIHYEVDKPIILARPPVVLVHGINNDPSDWNPFINGITGQDWYGHENSDGSPLATIPFVTVNHNDPQTFSGGLDTGNEPVELGAMLLSERIQKTLAAVRTGLPITDADENSTSILPGLSERHVFSGYGAHLAIRRVDVVAWSYGGVITRWYLNQTKPLNHGTWYNRPFSYQRSVNGTSTIYTNANLPSATSKDDIRKVVTLGSMWRGVPLINYGNEAVFGRYAFGQAPISFKGFPVTSLYDLINSHDISFGLLPTAKFTVPSCEVMAIESNWMRQLIYGTTADPSASPRLEATPFAENVAYGSVAGDNPDYPIAILGPLPTPTHPYPFFDVGQSPSFFTGLSLEYPMNGVIGYSDGLIPIWSSAIPGSYVRAYCPHNGYAKDLTTQKYVVQSLNSAALPMGSYLNSVWNSATSWNDDKSAVQTRDGTKRWRYMPGLMAPYPQSDLYIQVAGEGRLNPEAIATPIQVPINLLQNVNLARDAQNNITATVTMANVSFVLAADVNIVQVTIIVGSVISANITSKSLGTLHFDPTKGPQTTSATFNFPGSLGPKGQPARIVVSYTYAGSRGQVSTRLNAPNLVLP